MFRDDWLLSRGHSKLKSRLVEIALLLLLLTTASANQQVSLEQIERLEHTHAGNIKKRFAAWKKLIVNHRGQGVQLQLSKTNDFFNQFYFQSDLELTGEADYWKSPDELIVDGGGDCEDFAIAKYFTLLAMGVPMDRLRITYVKAIRINQAHMVLTYYSKPNAEPLILDNLESKILPASKRPDLYPIYSFNGESLWLAKQREQDKKLGNSSGLSKWRRVIERMKQLGILP